MKLFRKTHLLRSDMNSERKGRAKWSQENLFKAVTDVRHGCLSTNAASKKYDIPRRTLRRYLEARKVVKSNLGCKTTLTKEQEKQLCKRIFRLAEIGFPLTSKMLRLNVFQFCHENSIANRFTKGYAGRYWLKAFMARNPEVERRKVESLNYVRTQKLDEFIVVDYFEKLRKVIADNNLLECPEKIFNMDEKCCRLQLHKGPSVLAKKGFKRIHIVAKEHGESVTIVACGNAAGLVIPPMILFSGVRKNPAWEKNLPTGSYIKRAPKGNMTTKTFIEFLKHFSRFKSNGTCLLIFNGAKSHLDYKICKVAEENDILLYCLPSYTTHELQPLSKSCFQSFEDFWDQHALLYLDMHKKEKDISRLNFAEVFTPTWEKSMTQSNMKSGFKATGIFPFNPVIVFEEAFVPSMVTEQPLQNTDTAESSQKQQTNHFHSVATTSGLWKNVHQQHHRLSISSSSASDCSEIYHEPSNILSDSGKEKGKENVKPATERKLEHSTKKIVSQKTLSQRTESWNYCTVCCTDEVKDMRVCIDCGLYVHEECVGLTEEDKDLFICPKCM